MSKTPKKNSDIRKLPVTKSRKFIVLTRTIIEREYIVLAPSAKAALLPIETLVEHFPCTGLNAKTKIINVLPAKQRRK